MEDFKKKLGARVRMLRREKGMTQVDLAKAMNMAQPTIANIEKGKVMPSVAALWKLEDILGEIWKK